MRPGDVLLCYLTGVSRWIGLLEVTGEGFESTEQIWRDNIFPSRIPVKVLAKLDPLTAVPVLQLRQQLSIFQDLKSPHAWTGWFRASPSKWNQKDGAIVEAAILDAVSNPIQRPFDPAKLKKVPPILKTATGKLVTVPHDDPEETDEELKEPAGAATETTASPGIDAKSPTAETKEESAHLEIQWMLAKLGNDTGLDVWAAKNDRSKLYKGQAFTSLARLKQSLPVNFDDATRKTVELIDILWLKGNSIVAAFEIESTTQIFSGLLRMADLIAMQPNLQMPLYIAAPSERRQKVMMEVNRPVFARLDPPMNEMCSFIAFEELRDRLKSVAGVVAYLKPDFIDSIAEGCQIEEV